jgi:hypothetical protein
MFSVKSTTRTPLSGPRRGLVLCSVVSSLTG